MTDRDANERLLRLNAALDGELDAMGSLEFERDMRDDPAVAAEYRSLATLRDAVRRHAPREAAPQVLADRIAALTAPAPAPAAPPPQARRSSRSGGARGSTHGSQRRRSSTDTTSTLSR
jgi:anti-sigma factor RsiW